MSDALTVQACERKFGVNECPLHPGNDVVLHCEKCSVLVCLKCLTDQHKGHTFCQLDDFVNKKLNDVGRLIQNFNKLYISNTDQSITEIRNRKGKIQDNKTILLQDITKSFDTLNQQIQNARTRLEEKVNSLLEDQCEQLNQNEQKLVNLKEKSEVKFKELDKICEKGTLVEKYDAFQSLQKDEEEAAALHKIPEIYTPKLGVLDIIARTMLQSLQHMTNQLSLKPIKHAQDIFNATSFDNESPSYYAVTPVTEDKSWCKVSGYKQLCMINKQGSVEQELQTSADLRRLCRHPITGVLYGTFDDKTICTIDTATGATTTVLTCPYEPHHLTVTPDGDIIVGESTSGHVYRYSSNGQLLHQSKEKYYVCDISYSDINDHVAIARREDRVTIMDGTLTNVIHTHKLGCNTVVYDRDGSLMIGDWDNRSIHILDGQTFSTIRTFTPPQMSRPFNIRLYDNSMWVQCYNPRKIVHVMFQ